jgi:acyl-coenzyme A synthetase/AMP-(fatty) acid ligase
MDHGLGRNAAMNVAQPSLRSRAPSVVIPREYNFAADILKRNLDAGRAAKLAYVDPRAGFTYGELAERVERFGHVLRSLDVRREERILLCLLDTIDWPTAFLGAIKAGVVPIPVNTLLTEDDYGFMLADSLARLLVVSEELYPKFENAMAANPDLAQVIVSGKNAHGDQHFETLLANAATDPVTAPTVCDDMCFWLYTSGSTGKPKATIHTTPISDLPTSFTADRFSAFPRTTSATRWRNCSLPTALATRSLFRLPRARPQYCCRSVRRRKPSRGS